MPDTTSPNLDRRSLLKLGLGASMVLGTAGLTASLSGCSSNAPATNFAVLRDSDLPLLRALYPAVIGPHPAFDQGQAADAATAQLDRSLQAASPFVQEEVLNLLGMLSLPLTRGPLTGIWGNLAEASPAQLEAFLLRWRDSRFDLLRKGHKAITQLLQLSWYATPQSWAAVGYPGPPQV
ncbi:twin-arginine translocation pathway signal protein [Halopseudomonas maritima]|uniref:twin-arginine translocation pathway signal protein n=1 Tax=Halopseudomonas maritima TaxID=2918528 RepID=UPI001EEABA3E|nr:twin-arginine translocation pathway signal protein [Halopseudomonas maritima]UJJ30040.1 twin-arginine translocation pathway signal protein [Halopseudomonas maritima]